MERSAATAAPASAPAAPPSLEGSALSSRCSPGSRRQAARLPRQRRHVAEAAGGDRGAGSLWREENANVHRGVYRLSEEATEAYEHRDGWSLPVGAAGGGRLRPQRHRGPQPGGLFLGPGEPRGGRPILSPRWSITRTSCPGTSSPRNGAPSSTGCRSRTGRLDLEAFRSLLERGPRVVAAPTSPTSSAQSTRSPRWRASRTTPGPWWSSTAPRRAQAAARHGRARRGLLRAHRAQDVRADRESGAIRPP